MRISSTQTQSNNLAWCCIIQETCSLEATGFTTDLLTTIGVSRYIFLHVPDFQVLMFGDSQKLISWIWTKDMLVYWDSIIVLLKSCEKINLGTINAVFWPVYDLRFLIRKFTIKRNLNRKFRKSLGFSSLVSFLAHLRFNGSARDSIWFPKYRF